MSRPDSGSPGPGNPDFSKIRIFFPFQQYGYLRKAEVKMNHLSQKKIRPRPAFDGLWRPPEAGIRMPHPKLSLTLHKLSIGTHIVGVPRPPAEMERHIRGF